MKKICFVALIAFIFCDTLIPKYGSAKSTKSSDVFYFKTSDFADGSTIYFQLNADNGFVNSQTIYEFSDASPVSGYHSFYNPNSISTYSRGSSQTSVNDVVVSYCEKYYYEIKNNRNYKYLYIKYTGFTGTTLEAENTRFSIGILILIIVGIVVGTIIIIVVAVIIIRINKRRRLSEQNYINPDFANNNPPQYQTQTQNPTPALVPDYYNSNYPQQQQGQNIYYEPPTVRPLN